MAVRAANGRWARYYLPTPARTDIDPLVVTYHKPVGGKLRQLSVSPKLMRKMLRQPKPNSSE
jgi:hypothetical protein